MTVAKAPLTLVGTLISDRNQRSKSLTPADGALILHLIHLGFQHKRIAALFDVNQGRISEIATGRAPALAPLVHGGMAGVEGARR